MGVGVMMCVQERSKARQGAYAVLQCVADSTGELGDWTPVSRATIQRATKLDNTTIGRAIKRLVAIGELEYRGGKGRVAYFRITL